ncbi:MAG TPA: response regulator transcription factor [Verrucomicrobiae bacterium]
MKSDANTSPETDVQEHIHVWLVDDNEHIRTALRDLLNEVPEVRVTGSFQSPNAVLSALASRPGPDAILLDIQMGEANGLDAIRPIKALSRNTQVVMFTTFFDTESRQRALQNGATDFLVKNSPVEKIISTLQSASRHPAPHLKCGRAGGRAQSKVLPAIGRSPKRLLWMDYCLEWLAGGKRRVQPAR